jgi:hypothetical protein
MRRILTTLTGGLLIGAVAASYATLPAPTPEGKAAAAAKVEKDAAAKAKADKELAKAQDKAVANYRKNKDDSAGTRKPGTSTSSGATAEAKPQPNSPGESGADHAKANPPEKDLTRQEAQTEMPTPGQANDHSSTGRETVPSGR